MYKVQNNTRSPLMIMLSSKDVEKVKGDIPRMYRWGIAGDVRDDKSDASVVEVTKEQLELIRAARGVEEMIAKQQLIIFQGSIALAA